jgi:putative (di)nucleoside polyphosphate hydrolase
MTMAAGERTAYRANVGIALFHRDGRVFVGKRARASGRHVWQMPQGGVDEGEDARVAALREMQEEIGVRPDQVTILAETADWLTYDFPPEIQAAMARKGPYRGQRQKWFALRFNGCDDDIVLDAHTPEFDAWRWASLAETPGLVIPFKRSVYEEVARRFALFTTPDSPG